MVKVRYFDYNELLSKVSHATLKRAQDEAKRLVSCALTFLKFSSFDLSSSSSITQRYAKRSSETLHMLPYAPLGANMNKSSKSKNTSH